MPFVRLYILPRHMHPTHCSAVDLCMMSSKTHCKEGASVPSVIRPMMPSCALPSAGL